MQWLVTAQRWLTEQQLTIRQSVAERKFCSRGSGSSTSKTGRCYKESWKACV